MKSFVYKLEHNKSIGLDSIPKFVLQNKDVMQILYYVFCKLCNGRILPSM